LQLPFLQFPEQQSAFDSHDALLPPQQSSSLPELQTAGQQPSPSWHGGPVPASQFPVPKLHVSAPLQASPSSHSSSLPHGTSQSTAQLTVSSAPSHVPLPQQNGSPLEPQENPPSEQRVSPQSGKSPPQQYRLLGLPFVFCRQSSGHELQSSPGSHTPLGQPEPPPPPLMQSAEQVLQSSPLSHVPLPQQGSIGSFTHPLAGLQLSDVHGSLSAQLIGSFWQPPTGSQLSVVQALPSLQLSGVPDWHWPDGISQVSEPLQTSPSAQSRSPVQPLTC